MDKKPYIGIVGVKNVQEAVAVHEIGYEFLPAGLGTHCTQIGVQVTTRTLRGEITESRRNPLVIEIPAIFRNAMGKLDTLRVVHFTTKEFEKIPEFIDQIMGLEDMYAQSWCNGLQLNGAFGKVTTSVLESIRQKYPKLNIILQLHNTVLETFKIIRICELINEAEGLVDYVLIDPSGGRGQEMDVIKSSWLGLRIRTSTSVDVAFAGGLKGENVGRIITQLQALLRTGNFSIDAEGGLRDKRGEGYGNDDFNAQKAKEYFENAVRAFA